ncbi:hypothetical protein MNV84_04241 [Leishmania braziliensis]|nr:hypothetical protein MNV84_04241 [Leishmania braziliensis]
MERSGFGDVFRCGNGGGRGGAALLTNESSSLQRTAKARAHAAQYLMMGVDNAFMPLLPDHPGKRISLHRQLRGRYNPTQIPLSSLSCAAYLSAGDVAQLATLFHQFSLFSSEVANTLDMDDGSGSGRNHSSAEGKSGAAVSATAMARLAKATKSRPRSPGRGNEARLQSSPGVCTTAAAAAAPPPVAMDVTHGKSGMGLVRCVARRPPPATELPESLRPASLRGAGVVAAAAGTAVPPSSFATPSTVRKEKGKLVAQTPIKMAAAVDRRELAEPFTSESNDAALTTGWLVELLLEMVIENSARSACVSGGGSGAAAAAAITSGQSPMPSAESLPPSRSGAGSHHPYKSGSVAPAAPMGFNASTTLYQARRREARVDELLHFKAELTAWAEHLAQNCEQCEHRAVWQQCAAQDELLQRYQACVLHSQSPRLAGSSLASAPGVTAAALSSHPKIMSFENFESAGVLMSSKAGSNVSPHRGGGAGGRGNVSWGLPHVVDSVLQNVVMSPAAHGALCSSPRGSTARLTKPTTDPQSHMTPTSVRQQLPGIATRSEISDADEMPSMHNSDSGDGGLVHASSPGEILQSTVSSFTDSMTLLSSNAAGVVASVAPPFVNAPAVGLSGAAADRSLIAVKAWLTAPALKDLLPQPAQLYAYLWTSSAAARLAEEETRDIHHHHRCVRMARGAQLLPGNGGDGYAGGSNASRAGSAAGARRSRAAVVQYLVCWSDVASNLLMGLETTCLSQRQESSYARVPTALLEDSAEMAAPKTAGLGYHIDTAPPLSIGAHEDKGDDDSDSLEDDMAGGGGTGVAGNGHSCRRRQHKSSFGNDAVALQQRAILFSSLGAAAENTLDVLHREAADHILASPTQCYTVTSSKDGLLKVWDTSCGQFVSTILNIGQSWVLTMTFLHGGEFLMVATSAAEITVVNFPAGGVLLKLRGCTSLATAVPQVKQLSTFFTKRYGLKPGECGQHKPTDGDGGGWLGAAAAARLMECADGDGEPIVARPIVGYVTPTAAFYDAEVGFFFFGTMSGMVGCIDLTAILSRTALHAAAAGAGWAYPLQVYDSVFAHLEVLPPEVGATVTPAPEMTLSSLEAAVMHSHLPTTDRRKARAPLALSVAASSRGVPVNRLFYCGVGHCIISSDPDGGIVRTSFTADADTLDYTLGTPSVVMATAKPIRFMVSCSRGRRFVTVHRDRRAFLWTVGRTLTECVHQYPQEAYDIIDACFMPPHQQVAMLMADHSIRIYDERGSRPLTFIQPPRGLSSRAEDIASMTLKCSANDVDGCLIYLPTTQRLVCGLRGPVLYEPAGRAPTRGAASTGTVMDLEVLVTTDAREGKNLNPTDAAAVSSTAGMRMVEVHSPSAVSSSLESSLSLPPLPQSILSFYAPTSTARAAMQQVTILVSRHPRNVSASVSIDSSAYGGLCGAEDDATSTETEKARTAAAAAQKEKRRQRQVSATLQKCHERLRPYQTHSSAVIGLLLDPERGELHSFSTDAWCVWCYETGKRLRAPLHVPSAAEKELAVRSRRTLLTCCSWSTEGRTRVLVGTRDSRVLTLDARVGSVMSTTEPFTQSARGPTAGASSPILLADRDVGAISSSGNRTLLCSGHVCEVRRYEVTSAPQPSGEQKFISMRVELPSAASAVTGSSTHGGGTATTIVPAAAVAKDMKGTTSTARGGCSDTTITACCVVRESHLCLGTADTQLFFYRMVDRSSPVHVEVLCDAQEVPDVGRVVGLNYLNNSTHDMLLAVVDTGILFLYSYTLQRTLGRYSFPLLGKTVFPAVPHACTPRAHTRAPQQQEHYITSVGLACEVIGAPQSSLVIMACGDSAGYVHVVPLAHMVAEASSTLSRERGVSGAARVPRAHKLRVAASFRASRGGISSLELLAVNSSKPMVGMPSYVATTPTSPEHVLADKGGRPDGPASTTATTMATPSNARFSEPFLLVFAAGFDGNVRIFSLSISALQQPDVLPVFPLTLTTSTSAWSLPPTQPQLLQSTTASASCTRASLNRAVLSSQPGCSSSFHTVGGRRASLLSHASGAMRYEVTTVGLCGVDTWDLCDPRTFSDVEQAMVMTQARSDGHVGVVLPSILDDVDDRESNAEGCGVAVDNDSAREDHTAAVGVASTIPGKGTGAVLLYDILRKSKKQRTGSSTAAAGANVQPLSHQPLSHQPRLAATTTVTAADGAALRQCGTAPGSQPLPPPPSTRIASPTATAGVAGALAVTARSRKDDACANNEPVRSPGWCASAALPSPFLPSPPPVQFMPHTIEELVRDALPSSWSRSTTMRGGAAAFSSLFGFPLHSAADDMRDDSINDTLSPTPSPREKRNPLVRVYPLALLRRMGLLHPLDTTPDIDPVTGLPVLISACEAFKPWEAWLLGMGSVSTAATSTVQMSTSLTCSVKSVRPPLPPTEVSAPASAVALRGTGTVINVPQRASAPSSSCSSSSSLPSGLLWPRRITVTASPTSPSLIPEFERSAGEEVEEGRRRSSTGVDDTEGGVSVFLTEGGVEWARPKAFIETNTNPLPSLSGTPLTETAAGETSFGLHRTTKVGERTIALGAEPPQRLTVRDSGEALSRQSISSESPSTALAWSSRSRPLFFPPAPPTPAQLLESQKLTYLRGVLGSVDADVLRMREDQMMLVHMARRLDCSRQAPPPACAGTIPTSTRSIPAMGEYTSRLMRLWRQRAGDTAAATVAAVSTLGAVETAGTPGTAAAAEEAGATNNARVATTAARVREAKPGYGSVPTRGLKGSGNGALGKAMVAPGQREPTVMLSSSRSMRRSTHESQSNSIAAYASMLQASPPTTFGLDLLALSLPNEPQAAPTRAQHRTSRGANAVLSARAAASPSGRGAKAAMSAADGTATSSKAIPHLEARLPMIAVQQEVQPIRVNLPSTLRRDEGERMWLRRFEAVFNSVDSGNRR